MIPPPTTLGLVICERVIIEEGTKNATLVSLFSILNTHRFPTLPRFAVYATFTDGVGHATIELVITRLRTNEEIYARQQHVYFPDKLSEVRVVFRVNECTFPAPGEYQATLLIDGDLAAQRRFLIAAKEA